MLVFNILLYVSLVGHGSVVSPDAPYAAGVNNPVLKSTPPPHFFFTQRDGCAVERML